MLKNKLWAILFVCSIFIFLFGCVKSPESSSSSSRLNDSINENTNSEKVEKLDNHSRILLVNKQNPLPSDFNVQLVETENGFLVAEECLNDLNAMLEDCRKSGFEPFICSAYRSIEYQQELFNDYVNQLMNEGYSKKSAEKETSKSLAVPGTSEHHTGLAVDIVDLNNQNLNENQANTPAQKWLFENCWKYGFILRYPKEKADITGIIYEPWHYRYVGKEVAKEMSTEGLCLEEYLN